MFQTPICLLACGIQFGKTKAGSVWMKIQNHKFHDPSDNFLIVAPTYKILTQSTLPPYLDIMRDCGTFSKSDMMFKVNGGGNVYCRSGTDPDSIVGITNIRAIWGDEAGLFSLYFSENLAARAAFKNAQTLFTTSPYSLNFLYRQIIHPKMKNPEARPDVTLIQAASWENPYFPIEVIERNRQTMDARRFNTLFGGRWEKMAGLVYDCFSDTENITKPVELPPGTRFFGGVDFGFTDPFVLLIRAITPSGMHYQVSETYKCGLTITDIIDLCRQKRAVFPFEKLYCDPSQPAIIEELCRAGIPSVGANNEIRIGIDRHYELIKTRKFKIFEGTSPHTIDELETYHYPEPIDLGPDKSSSEQNPVGQNDHASDASRYLTIMTYNSGSKFAPKVPGEVKIRDQFDRLKELKRKKGVYKQTETW